MPSKINLIIDTDMGRDVDDSFALSYAFANKEKFNIEAITISPFKDQKRHITAKDSIIEGALEATRTMRYLGEKKSDKVFKGSEGFVSNLYNKLTPAVERIIELGKKKNISIACLGPLTNIAIAIMKAPEIVKNLDIVWLGTRHLFYDEFDDTNYCGDKKAFEEVLKSGVKMTIIPSYIGKYIVTSKYEFERNVAVNDIGRYLLRKIKSEIFNPEDLGIKTLYDIAPIAYLVEPKWFKAKQVSVNRLFKEQTKVSMGMLVNYIYDMVGNQYVWRDFVKKVTKFGNEITPASTFFISDTHIGQMTGYKLDRTPFDSFEEYDSEIIARWNKTVSDDDTVYHLGDFGDYEQVKKLKGKIILVCGNYEKGDMGRNFAKFREKLISLGFSDVIKDGMFLKEKIGNSEVYLTHKPTDCKKGCMNLYGHVHNLKPLKKNGFNVCVTYHDFTPVSLLDVTKYVDFIKNYSDEDCFED